MALLPLGMGSVCPLDQWGVYSIARHIILGRATGQMARFRVQCPLLLSWSFEREGELVLAINICTQPFPKIIINE